MTERSISSKKGIPDFDEYIFHGRRKKYCLLIPIFNEIKDFTVQIERMKGNNTFNLLDIVVCDAGSTDGSTDTEMLATAGFKALLIRRGNGRYSTDMRMGYGWALEQGYEGVISVDGTNRDDTEALSLFIEKLDEGYDYIQGSRFMKGGRAINTPFIRTFGIRFVADPIMSINARMFLSDTTNGFRAYSRRFIADDNVSLFRDSFNLHELIYYLPVRACRLGYKVIEVPVTRAYPERGGFSTHTNVKACVATIAVLLRLFYGYYDPKNETVTS
jgi:dolichol-phosphate mannosyltransferase